MRCCGANANDAKILEVYTELPLLDIRVILPINIKREIIRSLLVMESQFV